MAPANVRPQCGPRRLSWTWGDREIMTHKLEHAERWKWFLDIVFGAIVALAIQKYEPVVRVAWSQGLVSFSFSLFVSICVCSFVVYDISAYHILVKEFAYSRGKLGFMRFYLDLIMAFYPLCFFGWRISN
jgi:hypothetical protein